MKKPGNNDTGSTCQRLTDEERGRTPCCARQGDDIKSETRQTPWKRKYLGVMAIAILLLFYASTLQSMIQAIGASHPDTNNHSPRPETEVAMGGANHIDTHFFDDLKKKIDDTAASAARAAASATEAAQAAETAAAAATAAASAANSSVEATATNRQHASDLRLTDNKLPNEGRVAGRRHLVVCV